MYYCESKEVEDEIHFAVSCENYGDLRDKFYRRVFHLTEGKLNLYRELDKMTIFRLMVGCDGVGSGSFRSKSWNQIFGAAQNFLYLAMKRRRALGGEILYKV